MPRYVRFPGPLLTASLAACALLVGGCTSGHPQAAVTSSGTGAASTPPVEDTASPTDPVSPSDAPSPTPSPVKATPTKSAKPSPSPSPSTSPTTAKPRVSHSATPSATPSPTPTPTKTTQQPPATVDPIIAGAYAFPIAGCHVSYGSSHHDYPATDIFASTGCHFVATTAGTVDEVSYSDSWKSSSNAGSTRGGLFVSIVGDDGVRYYGSHLSAIAGGIAPGVRVNAGDLLGLVGNSGDARGVPTHVHYGFSWPTVGGIWWVRRGWIYPYKYLNSWRDGVGRSPSAAIAAAHAAAGDIPKCQVDC